MTMGTTTNFGLPFPEGSDLVIGGDDAIQALAESLDARLSYSSAVAQIEPAESASVAPTSAVDFPGAQPLMSGFSYSGGVLTYSGPARVFVIVAELDMVVVPAGNQTSMSFARLLQNGVSPIARALDYTIVEELGADDRQGLAERGVTHRLVTVGLLGSGNTLQVEVSSTPSGATVSTCSLRVYPIGPQGV
jgi:hypothetical protein